VKNSFSVIFGVCAILIASYAAVAASVDGIDKSRALFDAIDNPQENLTIQIVIDRNDGNLASLEHRIYATTLKFSSELIVSNNDDWLPKATDSNCKVSCFINKN
jgi:hypothetical protein